MAYTQHTMPTHRPTHHRSAGAGTPSSAPHPRQGPPGAALSRHPPALKKAPRQEKSSPAVKNGAKSPASLKHYANGSRAESNNVAPAGRLERFRVRQVGGEKAGRLGWAYKFTAGRGAEYLADHWVVTWDGTRGRVGRDGDQLEFVGAADG